MRIIALEDVDLPPRLRSKVATQEGDQELLTANSLVCLTSQEISRRFQLSTADAEALLLACSAALFTRPSFTALSLLSPTAPYPRFLTTGCSILDSVFPAGRGIPTGSITEIYGEAGTGKSILAMQLCATVQLPVESGGLEGAALYFTTSNYFPAEMFFSILKRISATRISPQVDGPSNRLARNTEGTICTSGEFPGETLPEHLQAAGANVLIQPLVDDDQTLSYLCHLLPSMLKTAKQPIRLIIVDSLAAHFREDSTGLEGVPQDHSISIKGRSSRGQDLYECAKSLKHVAELGYGKKETGHSTKEHPELLIRPSSETNNAVHPLDPGIAVVVINQVAARMAPENTLVGRPVDILKYYPFDQHCHETDANVPSLGPLWSNMVNTRIQLKKKATFTQTEDLTGGVCKDYSRIPEVALSRCLRLEFSPCLGIVPEVQFIVTPSGITGL
ncbi:DNA repair protein xrcc3 [Gonapodya sp. JEL0774]|nr:DNA repair protein xrcc3 [Gonapodya sp. JEL0774]